MPLIDLIAGARPNLMKIAPIINALKAAPARGSALRYRLIHTGQHYDRAMSGDFFEQLGIPEPDVNLEVGLRHAGRADGRDHGALRESADRAQPSALCLVVGDVTSTMACSIAARKLGVPVAHVEGGHPVGRLDACRRRSTGSSPMRSPTGSSRPASTANENLRRRRRLGRSDLLRRQHDDRYAARADAALQAAGSSGTRSTSQPDATAC